MQTDISVNWLPKSQEILPTQVFSYLLCLFFCDIYIKHIYFLTMCLIFSKFILFWFLTYFAGLAINTIGFHPEIVMILYTVCITSWCIDKLNDKLHVIQYLLVWFNKFLNIVSFSCSTVPWASVHTSSSIGGRGNILKKYQKYFQNATCHMCIIFHTISPRAFLGTTFHKEQMSGLYWHSWPFHGPPLKSMLTEPSFLRYPNHSPFSSSTNCNK